MEPARKEDLASAGRFVGATGSDLDGGRSVGIEVFSRAAGLGGFARFQGGDVGRGDEVLGAVFRLCVHSGSGHPGGDDVF